MKHTYNVYGVRLQNNNSGESSFVMRVEAKNKVDAVYRAEKDSLLFGYIFAPGSGFAVRKLIINRSLKMKYTAKLSGNSWSIGPEASFDTITECRKFAELYGNTYDHCVITNRKGVTVGRHVRSTDGNGMDWSRASF